MRNTHYSSFEGTGRIVAVIKMSCTAHQKYPTLSVLSVRFACVLAVTYYTLVLIRAFPVEFVLDNRSFLAHNCRMRCFWTSLASTNDCFQGRLKIL